MTNTFCRSLAEGIWYKAGVIFSHGLILFGYWPWQLCMASVVHAILGKVSSSLVLDSFMDFLPEETKNLLSQNSGQTSATMLANLSSELQLTEILKSLEDLNQQLDSVGRCHMVWKPLACLLQMTAGLQRASPTLWAGINEDVLVKYRKSLAPTVQSVLDSIRPNFTDERDGRMAEERVANYLESFLWSCDGSMLRRFLIFSTASDVLFPHDSITVEFDSTIGMNRAPRAMTCSKTLTLSRTYISQQEFRNDILSVISHDRPFDSM